MMVDDDRKIKRAEDLISTLPDVILQHILCFIRFELAITTSLLSRRWRHVWCDVPSLYLDADTLTDASVNETLTRYTAPKVMNFELITTMNNYIPHIDKWIKFAMSHNVENFSLDFWSPRSSNYKLPDFFYINSSVKKLNIRLSYSHTMFPECTVSWTSLKKLSLRNCTLFDESMAMILSGCPLLENLTLYHCVELKVLDLSKSLRLRTLQVNRSFWVRGPTQIVAPHIYCLRLNSQLSCTLVDVSSLTEAKIELKDDFLQVIMVLKMLEKLQNAEKLTFGTNFIQLVSLAEICGVTFPMFKVKALTLETRIFQYVIPGIERLLQNSPNLEKLTVRARDCSITIPGNRLDQYLKLQCLNSDQCCWRSKDGVSWNDSCWNLKPKHAASFVELVLKNTKKLDKMVVLLDERYHTFNFKEMVARLSHNNNVTIVLSTDKPMASDE